MQAVNQDIFRAYDIRGVVGEDLDEERVYLLGRAAGTCFVRAGETRCVLGRDCRLSSPSFAEALCSGLTDSGVDTVLIGMVSTPIFYYAIRHLGFAAGVMVTASHNPPEFNGFKLWLGPTTMDAESIAGLYDLALSGDFEQGAGMVSRCDPVPSYLAELKSRFRFTRPVKVVVDGGNGMGGPYAVEALRNAGAEVVPLFCDPDGTFPNHHPDPTIETEMKALTEAVLEHGAELGIGLDGDADRIGVVDNAGHLLSGDELLAVFAADELKRYPGAEIVGDVKCSVRLYDDIRGRGGRPLMCATGHTLMKERMRVSEARLAGELSGHMFFRDWYGGLDDGVYAALRMVAVADRSAAPVSEMLAHWPETASTRELRVECSDNVKFRVVDKAASEFGKKYEIIDIDGVRIDFGDGWGLVRASNTQPKLVMRFEASDPNRLAEIRSLVEPRVAAWVEEG